MFLAMDMTIVVLDNRSPGLNFGIRNEAASASGGVTGPGFLRAAFLFETNE